MQLYLLPHSLYASCKVLRNRRVAAVLDRHLHFPGEERGTPAAGSCLIDSSKVLSGNPPYSPWDEQAVILTRVASGLHTAKYPGGEPLQNILQEVLKLLMLHTPKIHLYWRKNLIGWFFFTAQLQALPYLMPAYSHQSTNGCVGKSGIDQIRGKVEAAWKVIHAIWDNWRLNRKIGYGTELWEI